MSDRPIVDQLRQQIERLIKERDDLRRELSAQDQEIVGLEDQIALLQVELALASAVELSPEDFATASTAEVWNTGAQKSKRFMGGTI